MSPSRPLLALAALLGSLGSTACPVTDDTGEDGPSPTSAADTGAGTAGAATGGECFVAPACDPLAPSCAGGDKCVPSDGGFACTPVPPGTEELDEGEPCSGVLSCSPGLVCAPVSLPDCQGGTGCCVALCDLGAPQCPGGTSCSPYASDSSLCYADVGLCVVAG